MQLTVKWKSGVDGLTVHTVVGWGARREAARSNTPPLTKGTSVHHSPIQFNVCSRNAQVRSKENK